MGPLYRKLDMEGRRKVRERYAAEFADIVDEYKWAVYSGVSAADKAEGARAAQELLYAIDISDKKKASELLDLHGSAMNPKILMQAKEKAEKANNMDTSHRIESFLRDALWEYLASDKKHQQPSRSR